MGPTQQKGFGLVELMISITLGLMLSVAIIQVFMAAHTSARLQQSMADVQENARFAMSILGEEVRMAGFMGCASRGNIPVNVIALPASIADFSFDTVLAGEDDIAESNDFGAEPGTDVLHIKRASDESLRLTGKLPPNNANIQIEDNRLGFERGDYVLVSDCLSADIFRVTNTPKPQGEGMTTLSHGSGTMNSASKLSKVYGADAEVFGFENIHYFVRDTGRVTAAGNPVFGLYEQRLQHGSGGVESAAIELVAGVESMQLRYGVDTDDDRSIEEYRDADDVADWAAVLSVKIELKVVGPEENVVGRTGSGSAQELIDANGSVVPNVDGRLRKIFTNVFALRNKLP